LAQGTAIFTGCSRRKALIPSLIRGFAFQSDKRQRFELLHSGFQAEVRSPVARGNIHPFIQGPVDAQTTARHGICRLTEAIGYGQGVLQ
jgi:hypothetical protein